MWGNKRPRRCSTYSDGISDAWKSQVSVQQILCSYLYTSPPSVCLRASLQKENQWFGTGNVFKVKLGPPSKISQKALCNQCFLIFSQVPLCELPILATRALRKHPSTPNHIKGFQICVYGDLSRPCTFSLLQNKYTQFF